MLLYFLDMNLCSFVPQLGDLLLSPWSFGFVSLLHTLALGHQVFVPRSRNLFWGIMSWICYLNNLNKAIFNSINLTLLFYCPRGGLLPGKEAKCITDNWVLILHSPDPFLLNISIAFDKILTFVPLTETYNEVKRKGYFLKCGLKLSLQGMSGDLFCWKMKHLCSKGPWGFWTYLIK